MFFDRYPYTNFHNVNLDWVLQAVKSWGRLVEANDLAFNNLKEANESFKNYVTTNIQNLIESNESFKNYVENYLRDLDVTDEIRANLDQMLADGSLTPFLSPYISTYIDTWLARNVTPTTPPLDSSLTLENAAANAAATGRRIAEVDAVVSNQERVISKISSIPRLRDGTAANGGNAYFVTTTIVQKIPEESSVISVYLDATIDGATKYRWNLYTFAANAEGLTSINAIGNATIIRRVSTFAETADKQVDITFTPAEKFFAIDVTALDENNTIIPLRIASVGNCLTIYRQFGTAYAKNKADAVYNTIMSIGTTNAADPTLFKVGYIKPGNGAEEYVTNRIVTKSYLPKNIVSINVVSGYKYIILGYSEGDYLGSWNGVNFVRSTSWLTHSSYDLSQFASYDIKIIFAAINDTTISTAAAENAVFTYFGYHTDKTLTKSDVPADAKATGEVISTKANKRVYTSISAMVADPSIEVGEMCVTTGYYTDNDGGGGNYMIRSRVDGETENGGCVHFTSNGLTAELITDNKNTLNIKQWGAMSDGITDISDAYGRCIEYIKSTYPVTYYNGDNGTGGGIIYFPAGEYYVGSTLEARHYVHLIGENEFTTVIKSDANRVFYSHRDDYTGSDAIGRQNYFTLKNLSFVNCKQVLYLVQCIGTEIINCQFIGCTRAISLYLTVKIIIRNCLFRACTNAIYFGTVGNGPSTTVFIDKCWFRHCTVSALVIDCATDLCGLQPCAITDCIFEYNTQALDIRGSQRYPTLIVFTRGYFEGNSDASTISNASVIAKMDNFFAPNGEGVIVTPAAYNKTDIKNLSDTLGFTVSE